MADKKTTDKKETLEREYVIPLRKEWQKVANYRRTGRAAKFIKQFIARHMKVPERDVKKVKLDIYLNQEIWFRGKTKPPAKLKVKAVKEGDIVKVSLADMPKEVEFRKIKHDRRHKQSAKPTIKPKKEDKEEKTDEDKKKESEKEQSAAELKQKELKQDMKAQKHLTAAKPESHHRVALKK